MRGRKPIPTLLKLVQGNRGKRPIRLDEFRPIAKVPACPAHLVGEARKEWRRVGKLLAEHGIVSDADRGMLAMLCTQWSRYVEAETALAEAVAKGEGGRGLLAATPNGYMVTSAWLQISNRAQDAYQRMCVEFGLTPSSRARVVPTTTPADKPGARGPETDDKPLQTFAGFPK